MQMRETHVATAQAGACRGGRSMRGVRNKRPG
jgi:hypothetical protein